MSDYTSESPASAAARQRRRRTVITMGVLILGLFFAFWYGLSYYQADREAHTRPTPTPSCRPADPDALSPADVTVDVFNATDRAGLAASTSRALAARGFTLGRVTNDPTGRPAPAVAEVRAGPEAQAQAQVVLAAMPEGTTLVKTTRRGTTVSVALGKTFQGLRPPGTATGQAPQCPSPAGS